MKTFLATMAVLVGGLTAMQSAQAACPALASLAGTYGYRTEGFSNLNLGAGGFGALGANVILAGAYSAVGVFTITGSRIDITDTVSINGAIFRQETYTGFVSLSPVPPTPSVGTPALNSNNCIGTMNFNSGAFRASYDFVVVQGGAKLFLVDTDQGTAISGTAER